MLFLIFSPILILSLSVHKLTTFVKMQFTSRASYFLFIKQVRNLLGDLAILWDCEKSISQASVDHNKELQIFMVSKDFHVYQHVFLTAM